MHDAPNEGENEAERKLAAIMAADVVGFSRIMGVDEAGTLASLRRARKVVIDPIIARHRGRVFKVMGDGLLAEFPSSMLALRAAVAIQAALPGHNAVARDGPQLPTRHVAGHHAAGHHTAEHHAIVLRIGIHQGDVVVHGDDLLGDGVNIAARLELLSPHGGICISARVREDAFGKLVLPFEDGGEHLLKNIARPIRVFLLRPAEPDRPPVPMPQAQPSTSGLPAQPSAQADDRTLLVRSRTRQHSLLLTESASPDLAPGYLVILTAEPSILGRQLPSTVLLPGSEVSRTHCRLELTQDAAVITDLRSTNGTFVNDRRIVAPSRLASGDVIRIGAYLLRYVLDIPAEAAEATQTMRP